MSDLQNQVNKLRTALLTYVDWKDEEFVDNAMADIKQLLDNVAAKQRINDETYWLEHWQEVEDGRTTISDNELVTKNLEI